MRKLHLSEVLGEQIIAAARAAFPSECCGLLEGVETEDGWRVLGVHPAGNLADNPKRHFLIDPQTHFDLLRVLRGTERRIIGCFHSHPNGLAVPSETDRAGAIEPDFVWIVVAGVARSDFTLNAFVFTQSESDFVPLTLHG